MYMHVYTCTCNFQVCEHFKTLALGGRGKKSAKKRGRPRQHDFIAAVKDIQPHSFYPPGLPPPYHTMHTGLVCCVCMEVLNRPVLLPCNELVCGPCLLQWVANTGAISCPCCYGCPIDTQGVCRPSSAVMQMLARLTLTCRMCQQPVEATHYLKHLQHKCVTDVITSSPYELTVGQILETPSATPQTAVEKKAAGRIISRMITQHSATSVKVPTSGQVR